MTSRASLLLLLGLASSSSLGCGAILGVEELADNAGTAGSTSTGGAAGSSSGAAGTAGTGASGGDAGTGGVAGTGAAGEGGAGEGGAGMAGAGAGGAAGSAGGGAAGAGGACSEGESTCLDGMTLQTCTGGVNVPKSCAPSSDCKKDGACEPVSKKCIENNVPDGSSCNGGAGTCKAGVCSTTSTCSCPDGLPAMAGMPCQFPAGTTTTPGNASVILNAPMQFFNFMGTAQVTINLPAPFAAKSMDIIWVAPGTPGSVTCLFEIKTGQTTLGQLSAPNSQQGSMMPNITTVAFSSTPAVSSFTVNASCGSAMVNLDEVQLTAACL